MKSLTKSELCRVILGILLISGFIFRLILVSYYPHLPKWDEEEYFRMAGDINRNLWVTNCCSRVYVYPMILSLILRFPADPYKAVIIYQSVLDIITSFLIYLIARNIWKKDSFALIAVFTYLFHTLIASFPRFYLTETQTFFFVILTLYIFLRTNRPRQRFFLGLCMALLAFTKLVFWLWLIGFTLVLFLKSIKDKKFKLLIPTILGIAVILIYPVISNYKVNKIISPVPPLSFSKRVFYYSIKYRYRSYENITASELAEDNKTNMQMFGDTNEAFARNVGPYYENSVKFVKTHPFDFLFSRIVAGINYWNKSYLFYHTSPIPVDSGFAQIANGLFLFLAFFGIIALLAKTDKNIKEKKLLFFAVSLILYFTSLGLAVVPEERITMPVYPVLIIFIPNGIYWLLRKGYILCRSRS